jgi:hypothetical protein
VTLVRTREAPFSETVGIKVGEPLTGSTKGRLGETLTEGMLPSDSKNPVAKKNNQ